ncbi:MAG: hypothetical protein ABJZ69_19460 [Hyphomicrobiales bacterium]
MFAPLHERALSDTQYICSIQRSINDKSIIRNLKGGALLFKAERHPQFEERPS